MSHALPASFYRSRDLFERTRELVFPRSWHLALDALDVPADTARPFRLHEGFLDEPLIALPGEGGPQFLSNVCTHRAALLLDAPRTGPTIRCAYHGRCFDHAGRVVAAPGFDELADFPGPSDHLPAPPSGCFAGLPFVSPDPDVSFVDMIQGWAPFVAGLGLRDAAADPDADREFEVAAHWALYVDNYLEGLHVRFVHPSLARSIGRYAVFPFPGGVLQVAGPPEGNDEPVLELPDEHPFSDNRIAAIYVWLFPATMINVYPWGVSLNVVTPLDRDTIEFTVVFLQPRDSPTTGVTRAIITDLEKQIGEDIPIWENKTYHARPTLCDGDGPLPEFRRWCQQFYAAEDAA